MRVCHRVAPPVKVHDSSIPSIDRARPHATDRGGREHESAARATNRRREGTNRWRRDRAIASARRSMEDGRGWGVVTGDVGDRPTRTDTARPVLFRFLTARRKRVRREEAMTDDDRARAASSSDARARRDSRRAQKNPRSRSWESRARIERTDDASTSRRWMTAKASPQTRTVG